MVKIIAGIEYYTIEEFADIIKVSESTVKRWIDEGGLRFWQLRPNSAIRIPATEITRHIQE